MAPRVGHHWLLGRIVEFLGPVAVVNSRVTLSQRRPTHDIDYESHVMTRDSYEIDQSPQDLQGRADTACAERIKLLVFGINMLSLNPLVISCSYSGSVGLTM